MAGRDDAKASKEFGGIRVTTVDWPIVLTEFPAEKVTDASLYAALACLESLMRDASRTREKLFFITDLTRMREVPPHRLSRHGGPDGLIPGA